MNIKLNSIKTVCKKILFAVDNTSSNSQLNTTLQLKTISNNLHMFVTNNEYYVDIKLEEKIKDTINASVNAVLFLKLIQSLSTEDVSIIVKDTYLSITADGTYKIPLIFNDDKMLELPSIIINNPTVNFNINSDILHSIIQYNSMQFNLSSDIVPQPIQNLYYIDEKGAITFSSGACVNNFTLEKPVKLLMNKSLVKLFKLFANNSLVNFTLGFDEIFANTIQTKVKFRTNDMEITAILPCFESLFNMIPTETIRETANNANVYSIQTNAANLKSILDRFTLFDSNKITNIIIDFNKDYALITNEANTFNEKLFYINNNLESNNYCLKLNYYQFKSIIDTYTNDDYLTINFGNQKTVTVSNSNSIINVLAEVIE